VAEALVFLALVVTAHKVIKIGMGEPLGLERFVDIGAIVVNLPLRLEHMSRER